MNRACLVVVAVVAVVAAWLGAIAGLVGPRFVEPSNAEVREAAGRLVPSPVVVTGRESGERGFCLFRRCPYLAYVDTIGGGENHDARMAGYLAQAEREAWRLVKTERYAGAVVLHYERGRLRASIHVRFNYSDAIDVIRTGDGASRRGAATGAIVGCIMGASAYGIGPSQAAPTAVSRPSAKATSAAPDRMRPVRGVSLSCGPVPAASLDASRREWSIDLLPELARSASRTA